MKHLSIVRSMSTREADHERGRYYMHTGYVPNPSVEYPSYGSVVAHELEDSVPQLEIPPFVSIGGPSEGPGFLGMAYAPFQVDANGNVRDTQMSVPWQRMVDRLKLLEAVETRFINERRGSAAEEHAKVLAKTQDLLTSDQMKAFQVRSEPQEMQDEVRRHERRPRLPDGAAAGGGRRAVCGSRLRRLGLAPELLHDARHEAAGARPGVQRADRRPRSSAGCLSSTVVLCMGEFGRTPRINGNAGRDHFARAWSAVLGGGGIRAAGRSAKRTPTARPLTPSRIRRRI